MRREPRVGAETKVGEIGSAKEATLHLPADSGKPLNVRPGLPLLYTHLHLCLVIAQTSGPGAFGTAFHQRPGYSLDMVGWVGWESRGDAEKMPPD